MTNEINQVDGGVTNLVPLNRAALQGNAAEVTRLLEAGAFPDGQDETGFTPLMVAAREGHTEVVRLLIDAGADVNRLGYVQRFYPRDFAEWQTKDPATIELITRAGGHRVDDVLDVRDESGAGVIAHVSRSYAGVYPTPFLRAQGGESFAFWLGSLRSDHRLLYLFSAGLSERGARQELGLLLPYPWAVLNNYRNEKTIYSFPLDLLTRMAQRVCAGQLMSEGSVISREDPDVADLRWPDSVRALIAVDHQWEPDRTDPSAPSSDDVSLFTLAPIVAKSFRGRDKEIAEITSRLRTAKSQRLALPYYWIDRI